MGVGASVHLNNLLKTDIIFTVPQLKVWSTVLCRNEGLTIL